MRFRALAVEEIAYYVDRFRPFDKAGGYGIQEWIGYVAIESINGSFYNVMGLPVQRLYVELDRFLPPAGRLMLRPSALPQTDKKSNDRIIMKKDLSTPTSRRKRPCRMPRIAAAILLTALTAIAAPKARADGDGLPSLIGERIDDMRAKGFRLTAEDIYSVNEASMKDAVVLFNGGCTGELISPEGLLVTNHHCGYGAIQGHSTVEHDYLTHGFWARDRSEELPNEGLWVRRLVRMEEVTDRLAAGETAEKDLRGAAEKGRYRTAIEQMYYGNQQFLFVYEQFDDVRLVGAPPSSIGKFGGDTDLTGCWPRHTGDFSLFRIYADRENRPAKFSRETYPTALRATSPSRRRESARATSR